MRSHIPIGCGIRIGLITGWMALYRGMRIGYLYEDHDGFLRYVKVQHEPE